MDNLQASPRNSLGYLADLLHSVKGFGDKASVPNFVPLIGGIGLGELLMGKSPELMDDMSYNPSSAIRGGNRATGGLGTLTLDKRSADLGMTLADMVGLGYGTTKLASKGAGKLINSVGTDMSRREFMKKAGALGAGAAATAATPSLLRKFAKEAEHVVPKVADNVANSTVKHKYNSLAEYLDEVYNSAYDYGFTNSARNDGIASILKQDERAYEAAKIGSNTPGAPRHESLDAFSPQAKKEMNAYKEYVGNQVRDRKALDYFRDPEYMPYDEWGSHLESSGMDLQDAMEFGIKPPISHERAAAIERNYAEKAKSASPFEEGYHWTPEAYEGWSTGYPDTIPF